jgi:hypothetical protein
LSRSALAGLDEKVADLHPAVHAHPGCGCT